MFFVAIPPAITLIQAIAAAAVASTATAATVYYTTRSGENERLARAQHEGAKAGEAKAKEQYEEKFQAMSDLFRKESHQ